ncbi:NADH-quinone oxidoreductase subunit NuoN [bacterium]|nr:NADH-quinone oxidoreductase subunit NuoN [bacterium]
MTLISDLQIAAPEILLSGFALVALLVGAFAGDGSSRFLRAFSTVVLALASLLAFRQVALPPEAAFGGLYQTSEFTSFAKGVVYAIGAGALFMSGGAVRRDGMERYEFPLLMIFASFGAGVMLSAGDLMSLYMGVECLSLSSYVLAAFLRDDLRSSEAGLKYFVLGALASGLLLYGASLVYGFAGSTRFDQIADAPYSIGLVFGLVLMICGLAFKASAAPFHIWTPDVYEGGPSPVVAFFATAPKIAAVVVFANVLFSAFGVMEDQWALIVAVLAAASMLIGAFGALNQNNIKRLLAYSSIGNVGFALIGVAAGETFGTSSILVYMTIYVVATLGLFGGVLAMRRDGKNVELISDLNGLSRMKPALAIALTALVFSVAGIPPLAGFFGKLMVFRAGLQADLLWLVIVGVISSVVSLGYYLRIIWAIWGKEPAAALDPVDFGVGVTVVASTVITFPVLVIWIGGLINATSFAAAG